MTELPGPAGDPAVDILMATFNGREFIDLQIASVLAQSHENFRLLIRDDGSDDGTRERLAWWSARDPRVTIVDDGQGRLGAAGNFLALLRESTAGYVMFADQDDIWMSSKLARSLAILSERTAFDAGAKPTLVVCDAVSFEERVGVVSASTQVPRPLRLEDFLFLNGGFYGCCMLLNRELVKLVLRHPVEYCAQHDHLVSLLALTLGRVIHSDERLMFYRRHPANVSGGPVSLRQRIARFLTRRPPIVQPLLWRAVDSFVRSYGSMLNARDRHTLQRFLAFPSQSRWANAVMILRHPFRIYGTRALLLSKLLARPLI